jgi:hypothetical protein
MSQATPLLGRKRLSKVRRRSATIDRATYLVGLHLRHRGDMVLVYSMPKVGSSTMQNAIVQSTSRPALHFHNMTRAALAADKQWWRENSDDHHMTWQWRGEYARYRVRLGRTRAKWDIVNGVREPIARLLSAFFQVGQREGFIDPDLPPDQVDLDRLRDRFVARLPGEDWFRSEFEPATGLDVYRTRFDSTVGWGVVENERFRALTIRQEDLERVGPTAMAAFLDEDRVELPRRNLADEKSYQALYARFRDEVRLPGELVEAVYSSEQATHFYSPAELDTYRARWLG